MTVSLKQRIRSVRYGWLVALLAPPKASSRGSGPAKASTIPQPLPLPRRGRRCSTGSQSIDDYRRSILACRGPVRIRFDTAGPMDHFRRSGSVHQSVDFAKAAVRVQKRPHGAPRTNPINSRRRISVPSLRGGYHSGYNQNLDRVIMRSALRTRRRPCRSWDRKRTNRRSG